MTDYTKDTGSTGEMKIVDNGTTVEFWLNSHNSSTYNNQLPWGYTVNGVTDNSNEKKYSAGAGWVKFGSWTVSTSQTVVFRIFDTGTTGFGGPTTLSVAINRATVPGAPTNLTITNITGSTMRLSWTDGAANGAAITARQVARNTTNTKTGANIFRVDTATYLDNTLLVQGTTYYYWVRDYNSEGWGAWSSVKYATTLKVPDAPGSAIISNATQVSFLVSFTDNGNGGSAITERQVAYSVAATGGAIIPVTYTGVMTISGLQPATTYYVWTRVKNSVGWSAYSAVKTVRTIAGAYVKVDGVQKEAIPYVNVGGVWRLARPWSRVAGVWKQST